ncbi:low molecular weight protein-tyrosine-phosphatase [Speluncibacter jeojiensis]|uniref:low molecular weight protein-tyrosine-phosphatase n=1 Tax=Speluncibacter jeojiensis TaxID=2710754 RepID=UPI0038CD9B97
MTRTEPPVTEPDAEPTTAPRTEALHVSFVCTGNICRSPMAEKIFAEHLRRAGLTDRVRVSSAGTSGWHIGDDADERTNVVLRAHGYPTGHAAAQVDDDHLDADLLLAMDTGHLRALLALGVDPERVRLLRSFDPDADDDEVADPYYGGADEFERVRVEVEDAVPGLLEWVREQL